MFYESGVGLSSEGGVNWEPHDTGDEFSEGGVNKECSASASFYDTGGDLSCEGGVTWQAYLEFLNVF